MHHRLLRALVAAIAVIFLAAAPASASITRPDAGKRALAALGVKKGKAPVIVFQVGKPLAAGSVVTQAGESKPPTPSGKLGIATRTAPVVLKVGAGHSAWAFYADWAPYQAFAHRGQVALVDTKSGAVKLSSFLTSPPVINGKLPSFMRSGKAYQAPGTRIFERTYTVNDTAALQLANRAGLTYRVDRAPLKDQALAKQAADQLAADHTCVLRVSDTYGDFYDFTGADNTRARLGDLFYVLRQLNSGIVDERYTRTSGVSPVEALRQLIATKGCQEVFLYVAGRGFASGGDAVVSIGTRVKGRTVQQQLVRASDLQALIHSYPNVHFSIKVDAPYTKPFVDLLAKEPNVLLAETAAGSDGTSFGFLPYVTTSGGKRLSNTGNPDGLLAFTNRTIAGITRFLTTADEVTSAITARKNGSTPSFLAALLGRAFTLGLSDDLPSIAGIQKPFFSPTVLNPKGPPSFPITITLPNHAPLGSPLTVTTPEDTPITFGVPATDPDNELLSLFQIVGPSHGTLTSSGLSITYTPDPDYAGPDQVSFTVGDPHFLTITVIVPIIVTGVNDKPRVTTSAGTATFTEGGAAVSPDPAVNVVDVDDTTLTGATVAITSGGTADDQLLFTTQNGITGNYVAGTRTLTLTGNATVAQYQAALRSVTFRVTGANPTGGPRTVAYRAADASGLGNPASRTVNVNTINDAPVLTSPGAALAYTENDAPKAIDSTFAISDPDSPNLAGATVAIIGNFVSAQDRLRFTNAGTITGSYDIPTGVLTLSGTATVAQYEAALRTVAYENLSDDPSTLSRTITSQVNDGAASSNLSNLAVTSVNITAVNDAPTVATSAGTAAFTENGAAVAVDPGAAVADVDSASISGAQVSITSGFASGDVLAFANTANITGSYNAGTGVLTLSGTDTVAAYQAALRAITFATPSDDPTASRTVSFKVSDTAPLDSNVATRGIAITAVNDAPTLASAGPGVSFTEGGAAVAVSTTITANDVDSANLTGATVSITGNFDAGDVLAFTDTATITGSFNAGTGVLTLSGTDTVAAYQAALRTIKFSTPSANPSTLQRTVSFKVKDAALDSNVVTNTVSVTAVNGAPTVTTSGGSAAFTENGSAVAIDPALAVADADSANLSGATVELTGGFVAGDVLAFTDTANITGSYNAGTGKLTLTGSDTVAAYQAALRTVTFSTPSDNPTASRTVSFKVTDTGALDSSVATRGVTITAVNDAPVLGSGTGTVGFTENGAAVVIASTITVNDPDSASLTGGTVSISGGFAAGDALHFTDQNGITGSYDAGTGELTLSGTATLVQYRDALRSITYSTASENPSTTTRDVTFVVDDGQATGHASNSQTSHVTVTATNDAPVVTTTGGSTTFTEGDAATVIDSGATVSDVDSANLASATITISAGLAAGDTLAFTPVGSITGVYNAGTGALALTGAGTVAEYQTALRSVRFFNGSTSLPTANRTISFVASDGTDASAAATKTVHYSALNSAPTVTASAGATSVNEGAAGAVIDSGLTVTDSDDANLDSARVKITTGFVAGDTLSFTNGGGITGSYDSGTGTLDLTGTATVGAYESALRSVKFSNAGPATPSGTRTITFSATDSSTDTGSDTKAITFTAVDDAPVVSTSAGATAYQENDPPTAIDASLTVSDPDSANLASAQVSITDPVAGDRLGVPGSIPAGFTVTGDGTTTIDISGAKTVADYRDLLRGITFESTSDNPTSSARHVRFKAADATTTTTAAIDKSVAVTPVNDIPIAVADSFTTDEDTVALGDVRANDTDLDDATSALSVDQVNGDGGNVGAVLTTAKGAKVTIDASGNLSYDPRGVFDSLQVGDANGTDSVTYRVKDPSSGISNTVTVDFTITPVNDAPAAVARTYNAVVNAALELEPAANSGITAPKLRVDGDLLQGASDADDPVASATITDQTVTTTGNGSVDLDPDGSFVYTSEPGENAASDTFTFQIKDTHGATSNQTVTLNFKAKVVFVDADNAGAADGTSLRPYGNVAAATTAGGTGDTIYVADAAGQTPSSATLKNNQVLTGAGQALTVNLGATGTPSGNVTLKAATTAPTLSASSGAALTLGSGNTVQSLNIDTSGSAKGIAAANAGTVAITDVNVADAGASSTGTAVDLTNAAGTIANLDITTQAATGLKLAGSSVNVGTGSSIAATGGPAIDSSGATGGTLAFGNVSSTNSSGAGISLAGAAAFSATGGAVSNSAGIGVDVSGGNASITYPGNVSPASGATASRVQNRTAGATTTLSGNLTTTGNGTGVSVSSNTGGTVTYSGASQSLSSGSGNAVSLSSNSGATVNFTGGALAATSTTGDAFRATGGGTVSVTGANNTLSAGSGAAVHVDSTNTNGLTFKSVNDTGGSEGIFLNATGSGASLSVTGDATTTRNTSGGQIANVTGGDGAAAGNGVYLSDTDGVSLEQMKVTGSSNSGVLASNVNGLAFTHGFIDNNGSNEASPYNESNARITTAIGTLNFDDDAISTPQSNNVYLTHNTGSATLNVKNSALTMDPTRSGSQNDGVLVDGGDTGSLTATITNNTFSGAAGDHVQLAPGGGATANAAWTANVSGNTMTSTEGGTGDDLGGGVTLNGAAFNGTFDYTVDGNTVKGTNMGPAILSQKGSGTGHVDGTISNNVIGISGDERSGSFQGGGIYADAGGTGGGTDVLIQNNTVHGDSEAGIQVSGSIAGGGGVLNATIKNNSVDTPSNDAGFPTAYGIRVNLGVTAGQTGTNCADVSGNTVSGTSAFGWDAIRMQKRQLLTVQLPGYTGALTDTAAVNTYLAGRNGSITGNGGINTTASGASGGYTNTSPAGSACPQP